MRNLLWVIVAVVIVGGGYILFSGKSIDELTGMADDAGETVSEEAGEAAEAVEEAATAAEEAAGEAVETGAETAEDAAAAVEEAVEDAAGAVEETVEEAAGAADEAMDDATQAAEGAADAAAETAEEAANGAEAAMSDDTTQDTGMTDGGEMADTGTEAAPAAADPEQLFSVEGFDLDKAIAFIEDSDLGTLEKTALIETIKGAAGDQENLAAVLENAREQLGL